MDRLNCMTNPCFQWMLSFILKCKYQPDSYVRIIRIFWQNVFLQKNALLREHNFLQKYFGFCEAFSWRGLCSKTKNSLPSSACAAPCELGKAKAQVQALSDSEQDCKSVVHFPGDRCSSSYWLLWFILHWSGKKNKSQSTSMLFLKVGFLSSVFHWWQLCY